MTKTAYGYTRLSQQSDTSIANQRANIWQYGCDRNLVIRRLLDDGEQSSGFKPDDLDAYEELRNHINAGHADAIIVNDKRRLVRDENEVMRLVADLRSNGVELHTHQDGQVDLEEPMQAAIEILRAASAAEEKRKEIERSIEAIEKKKKRGDDLGRPKFGMTYNDSKTKQVPGEEFDTVMEILKLRRDGNSYHEIEDELGVTASTAYRVVQRREWYIERTKPLEE